LIKLLPYILLEEYIYILALEMASSGNRHCTNCIGALSFPICCGYVFQSVVDSSKYCGSLVDLMWNCTICRCQLVTTNPHCLGLHRVQIIVSICCAASASPPAIGERNIAMVVSVCLFVCVCLIVRPRATSDLHQILRASYLWPRLGHNHVALRYVAYFRFYE